MIIKVLGTAQDAGVPHPNCYCPTCKKARMDEQTVRLAASLSIYLEDAWYLIDPTPDFKKQLHIAQQQKQQLMNGIFLTHAHIGHYTGMMFLGKEAIATKNLPVYAGKKMKLFLENHYPWKQLVDDNNIVLKNIDHQQQVQLADEATVTPLAVPHRNEFSETFGFIFSGKEKQLLYIPDIDSWDKWAVHLDEIMENIDYCLIDGTFYDEDELVAMGRDYTEIPHPLIKHSIAKFTKYKERTKIYFTHFNHSNPVLDISQKARENIVTKGFHLLADGDEFIL